jgi:hypothetical protein
MYGERREPIVTWMYWLHGREHWRTNKFLGLTQHSAVYCQIGFGFVILEGHMDLRYFLSLK